MQSQLLSKNTFLKHYDKWANYRHLYRDNGFLLFAALYAILFVTLWVYGPIFSPDTDSYISYSPIRSAIYPLLLKLNGSIFGKDNFQWLLLLQLLFGFSAVIKITHTFKKLITLDNLTIFLMTLVLLAPYYGPSKFGNYILTEGICYPLFLWVISSLIIGILGKNPTQNRKELLKFLTWTLLLVLTRKQFLFLFVAYPIVLSYLWFYPYSWMNRNILKEQESKETLESTSTSMASIEPKVKSPKTIVTLILCFLITVLSANLIERSLTFLEHGKWSAIPFTGVQMIIAPLFLSEANDERLFNEPLQKKVFQLTYEKMNKNKFNWQREDDGRFNLVTLYHFMENYNNICWQTLGGVLFRLGLDPYQTDTLTQSMVLPLIFNHLHDFITLIFMNIVFNTGGFYLSFFLIALTILAMVHHFLFPYSHTPISRDLSLLWLISFLLTAGNYSLISLVEPVLLRYTTYSDTIQVSVLLILASYALRKNAVSSKHDSEKLS